MLIVEFYEGEKKVAELPAGEISRNPFFIRSSIPTEEVE